jgi:hypothetical protein
MEQTSYHLAVLIGSSLGILIGNPSNFLICLIMCTMIRKKYVILLSSVVGSVITEFLLVSDPYIQSLHNNQKEWGDTIFISFFGCFMFSSLCYFIIYLFSKKTK